MRPPSVDALARSLVDVGLPHPLLVDAARAAIAAGDPGSARARAEAAAAGLLRPVINATGVLLHTNLGRAPLAPGPGPQPGGRRPYSNLELDLATGRRGSRHAHAAGLLARAVGAEAALVVNNGAGCRPAGAGGPGRRPPRAWSAGASWSRSAAASASRR